MKENLKQSSDLSPTKRALLALNKMQAKLDALEREKNEAIAIIGMGCRFPGGGDNPEAFWQILRDGVDTISEIPKNRWNVDEFYDPDPAAPGKIYCRYGGFLKDVEQFDPQFFGISPREAMSLDPQQRLLLEVSYEALEHANQSPDRLFESRTGVFVGLISTDYAMSILPNPEQIDAYFGTGNSYSVSAGRLSYILGLTGPSMTVDTSCSSSLIALHLACHSLRRRECDMSLVCGANLILAPILSITFSKAGMLAPDGRCKTFDASANGYVRGEGCGVVILKRLSDAAANRDNILAVIRGTAVNQDGPSGGLTVPNGPSQEKVIREALQNSRVEPSQVSYIEAHGTGTSLGDPIEIGALAAVFGKDRTQEYPLIVGSVKTNVGHLESAAGMASLIKVLLSLQHEEIPPHLHFKKPNPHISWDRIAIKVPTERMSWPVGEKPRIAGISSFGVSGTNAHVLVEEGSGVPLTPHPSPLTPHLLCLSARTEKALGELAGRYEKWLSEHPKADMGDVCFSANTGRSHFNRRVCVTAETGEQAKEKLSAFRTGHETSGILKGQSAGPPRIVFLFTGQGAQYIGMGRELYETQPLFRTTLDRCNEILRDYLEKPLLEVIYSDANVPGELLLNETAYTQPALFALEYALAALWQSWGVKPHAVMGHSVGEYAAACIAGVFGLEDGLKLIAERGRLMQSLPRNGEMLSVQADEERVISAIAGYENDVSIAASNGPRSFVISGKSDTIRHISDSLKNEGVKVKKLEVSHAFHSPLMEPMLADFATTLNSVSFHSPRIAIVSNLTGDFAASDMTSPEYWLKHVRHPVRFFNSMDSLYRKRYQIFLEIGPKPVLLGMGRLCLPKDAGVWLPGLRPNRPDWQQLLESLAELYVRGVDVDWLGFDKDCPRAKVHLPTYPFQRQRYWIESVFLKEVRGQGSVGAKNFSPEPRTLSEAEGNPEPLIGTRLNLPFSQEIRFESRISCDSPPHLKDHRIFGTVVMPAASHISLVLSGVRQALHTDACVIEELLFSRAIALSEDEIRTLQLIFTPCDTDAFSFQIVSIRDGEAQNHADSWVLHSSGKVRLLSEAMPLYENHAEYLKARCGEALSGSEFYAYIQQSGYVWGPSFQWTETVWRNEKEALCRITKPSLLPDEVKDYQLYPGLLDACFQLLGSFGKSKEKRGEPRTLSEAEGNPERSRREPLTYSYMPFRVEEFNFYRRPEPGERLWSHVRLEDFQTTSQSSVIGNLSVFDDAGQVIATVRGFEFRKTSRESLLQAMQKNSDWFYEVVWNPKSRTPNPERSRREPRTWLIFADQKGFGTALAARLKAHEERCVTVFPGQGYEIFDGDRYEINPAEPKDFQRLAQECGGLFKGIILMWGLDETESSSLGLKSAICIVQAGWSEIPRLWLVTQGAQPVREKSALLNVHQSPLWGLGQVIALEHPDFHCVRLDLDSSGSLQDDVQALFEEIAAPDEEPQIAWREGIRYVARLIQSSKLKFNNFPSFRNDASYLITGGTGALGLKVASQLVKNGVRYLILMSRRWASDEARQTIAQLEQSGATVLAVKADVSNLEELAGVFEKIKISMPQLRGIVHAAGVLDDGVLIQQNWKRFQKVLAPKAAGAWHLHNLTSEIPLDFFVCFSSIASLLGSPAQANYAAANAFLDALAHHRRAMGLPGLSINWGPWEQSGMSAGVSHRDQSRWKSRGVDTLPPEKGLEIFEQLLGQDIARIGVFRVDWSEFLKQFSHDRLPLFLEAFSQSYKASDKQQEQQSEFLRQLESLPIKSRREFLAKHIRSRIAKVLGLTSSENIESSQSLFEIGMDSLMAVELTHSLETELGRSLRSTLLFDYPTVEELSDYLTGSVLLADESATSVKEDAKDIQSEILSEIEQLSEDKLEAAINDELNVLMGKR